MSMHGRRRFVAGMGAAFAVGTMSLAVRAAMGPDDKFDLVIKGGELLDPGQKLRARRDIGIRAGRIEAIEADIPVTRASRLLDASGRLVLPGLVDLHSHVYPYGSAIGIPADELVPFQGTTTMVSAGDAGANNFAAFRRYVAAQARTRLYAFVHIANIGLAGFPEPELFHLGFAHPEEAGRTVAENADIAIGVKVRMSENVINQAGIEPRKRAIRACEIAGGGGDAAGLHARHDLLRHPRVLRQLARHALPDLGDGQVQGARLHARAGGADGHRRARAPHQPHAEARRAASRRARGRDADRARPGTGRVRRHAQQQAPGEGLYQAGAGRARRRAFRPALPGAVLGALTPTSAEPRTAESWFCRCSSRCMQGPAR